MQRKGKHWCSSPPLFAHVELQFSILESITMEFSETKVVGS